MRFLTLAAVVLPLVAAHGDNDHYLRHVQHARQATTTTGTTSARTGSASSGTSAAPPGTAAPSAVATDFSLRSTNPTAIPLASIVSLQPTLPTRPLDSTPAAGATPTLIKGAPPLPDLSNFSPAKYPDLDHLPPLDSPEVKQWKEEVANSGIIIPDFEPTQPGGCPNNTAFAANTTRCWWTCGGCTREKDVSTCPTPMHWGITYDDGPGFYTSNLMHYLDEQKIKSTFFVVGSRVVTFPHTLQMQYVGGHQIAVHTWSHKALTTLSNDEIIAELGWSKKAIKDVLGVTPNQMRPPFGDIDDRVRAISLAMGLVPVMWTRSDAGLVFNTEDFDIHSGVGTVQRVLHNWQNIIGTASGMKSGFISLEHDLFLESVEVATGYIIPDALAHNPPFTIEPVITCMKRSLSDAYIETNDNQTYPPTAKLGIHSSSASDATRQSQLSVSALTAMIVGVSGFAAGLFGVVPL